MATRSSTTERTGHSNYGVICASCKRFICIWPDVGDDHTTVKIFVPSQDPIKCPRCGKSHVYVAEHVIDATGKHGQEFEQGVV
jgi:hypothetical protein